MITSLIKQVSSAVQLVTVLLLLEFGLGQALGAPSDTARHQLDALVNNISGASFHIYKATDNVGHTMDCAKIIANPSISGQFIAVYHTVYNGVFKLNLAISTDLQNWVWIRELAGSGGPAGEDGGASQPTIIAIAGGGFEIAWEQQPNNHIRLSYFSSWNNLYNGIPSHTVSLPRQLSTCAEGTPNIYTADSSGNAYIGFHYWRNCDVDRQAQGNMTGWSTWSSQAMSGIDNAMLYWGCNGNIGDRDGKLNFNGYYFNIHEGQLVKNDWSTWRVFIYDWQTGNADELAPHTTSGASVSFANPTLTNITINGRRALLVTLYLPSQGNSASEAGECIYYTYY